MSLALKCTVPVQSQVPTSVLAAGYWSSRKRWLAGSAVVGSVLLGMSLFVPWEEVLGCVPWERYSAVDGLDDCTADNGLQHL